MLMASLFLVLGTAWAQAPVATAEEAITGLLNRIGGNGAADKFEIVIDANLAEKGKDVFVITSQNGKPCIKGNTQLSVATGINWYLNHYAHINLTWNNLTTDLSQVTLPVPGGEEKHVCNAPYRYDFNTCTFSYSMAFWTWERWQKEIDWMALHGINAPLNLVGLDVVTRNFLRELKVSESDIDAYIAGPGFIAWFAMNNLEGWGGTIESQGTGVFMQGNPDWWYTRQEKLCRDMLQRMRELGMQPVIPGFSGQVPNCIVNYSINGFSSGDVVNNGTWAGGYTRPDILKPNTESYRTFAAVYYKHLHEVMGVSELYSIDPFHEGSLPGGVTNETCYPNIMVELDKHFGNVEQSVKDTYKVTKSPSWIIQYWQGVPQSGAFTAMKNKGYASRFIGLDLFADNIYADNAAKWRTNYYDTCPYIYCMLHNFGGRSGLHGRLETTMDGYFQALAKNNNCQGIGATPEGTETNPILYDMLFELPWMSSKPNVDEWLADYAYSRYGVQNDKALAALQNLKKSVWDCKVNQQGTSEAVILARPNWTVNSVSSWSTAAIYWDTQDVLLAADQLYSVKDVVTANGGQDGIANYNYDFIDVVRQAMVDYAAELLPLINAARGDDAEYTRLYQLYLQLMLDLDEMLSYDENFKLERWTSLARNIADEVAGTTENDRNWLEWNARTQVTVWSKGNTDLHDYSNRCWAGLIKDFHYKRWKHFFENNGNAPSGGWYSGFEYPWTVDFNDTYNLAGDYSKVVIPTDMTATEKAAQTFGKYFGRVKGATKNYIFPMGVTRKATKSDVVPEVYRGKTVELPLIIGKNVTISSLWIDLNNDGAKGNGETLTATNNKVAIPEDAAIGKTTAQVVYSDGTDITFNLALVEDISAKRTVTAVAGANGSVAIEGTNELSVTNKDAVKMTATANTGYNFANWTKDGEVVSNDNPFIYYGKEAATFTANFIQDKWGVPTEDKSDWGDAQVKTSFVNELTFAYYNRDPETIYEASVAPDNLFNTLPQIINVPQGASFDVTWSDNGDNGLKFCCLSAYIDLNADGDFTDEGELLKVAGTKGAQSTTACEGKINVLLPYDAPLGLTHMRIRFDGAWKDNGYNATTKSYDAKAQLNRMCYEVVINVTEKSDKAATINVETNNAAWGSVEVWTDETPDGSTGTEWNVSANIPMFLRATKASEDVEFLGWYDQYGRLLTNELEYSMLAREDATYTARFRKALEIDGWEFEYRTEPGDELRVKGALAKGAKPENGKTYYIAADAKQSNGNFVSYYLYDNSGTLKTNTSANGNSYLWTCIVNNDGTYSFQNASGKYLANNASYHISIGETPAKYAFETANAGTGVALTNVSDDYTGSKWMVTKFDGSAFDRNSSSVNNGTWCNDYIFTEVTAPDVVILTNVRQSGDHDLDIPETVEILGEQCKIVGFDNNLFTNNKDLWTISLPSTIEFLSEKSLFNHTLTGNGSTQTFDVDIKNNEGWTITMDVERTGELTGWGACLIASGSNPAKPDAQNYAEGFQFYLQCTEKGAARDKLIIKTKTQVNDNWYFDDVYQEKKFTVVIEYNGAQQLSVNVLKADGTNATNHEGKQAPIVFTDCTIQDITQLCTNVQAAITTHVEIDKVAESDPFAGCSNLFGITIADGCSYRVEGGKLYNASGYVLHTLTDAEKAEEIRALGELIDNTEALMDIITTSINPVGKATEIALSTTVGEDYYIWCNNPHTGDNADARGGVAALLDEDPNTFLHTNYTNKSTTHDYLQINFGNADGLTNFKIAGQHRADGSDDRPKNIEIYGSNDNSKWTSIATVTGLEDKAGFKWSSNAISADIKYVYLKFVVKTHDNENNVGRPWFHMAKFDLFKLTSVVEVDTEYQELGGITNDEAAEVYDNLVNALYVYNNGGTADELTAAYNVLKPLYDALSAKKDRADHARKLSELINDTETLIELISNVTELALTITEGKDFYVSTNADQNTGGGNIDGGGIAALVDNNEGTYFHTRWGGTAVNEPHYIQVDLGANNLMNHFKFTYKPRNGSPAPTAMTVYGSNDGTNFTDVLATINSGLPAHNSGKTYESAAIDSKKYRYLRFTVTGSAGPGNAQYGGQYFFGMLEFDLFKLVEVAPKYKNLAGITNDEAAEVYDGLVNALYPYNNGGTAAELQAAYDVLKPLYDALKAKKDNMVELASGVYAINYKNGNSDVAVFVGYNEDKDNSGNKGYKLIATDRYFANAEADKLFSIVYSDNGYTLSAQGKYLKQPTLNAWNHIMFSDNKDEAGTYIFERNADLADVFKIRSSGSGINYINDYDNLVFGNDKVDKENLSTFSFNPVAEYSFTVTEAGMATLCLPFNVVLPEGMEAYDLAASRITESGDVAYAYMDVIAEEGDVLKAGTPVIVKAAKGEYGLEITMSDENAKEPLDDSLLRGNFAKQKLTQGQDGAAKKFIFANGNKGVGFYLLSDDENAQNTIGANKCWMEWEMPTEANVRSFVIRFGGEATDIEEVEMEPARPVQQGIYNLAGQRLEVPQKGVNIINGKKVVIK